MRVASLSDTAAADVALVVAERYDDGAQVLATTRSHPHAKRALPIGLNENRSAREDIIQFLARGDAEYYLAKPMASPDERFHRVSPSSSTTGGVSVVDHTTGSA